MPREGLIINVALTAKALAERGFATFPLNLDGTPKTQNGFKDASLDPYYTEERFQKYGDRVKIGIATGPSGIVVLDLDYKEGEEGEILVDGYDSLEKAWVDVPESFAYTSAGGKGRHIWYRAPEGKNLPRKIGYQKMPGVDRCSGEGYVVYATDSLPDKASLADAPEWLCDETAIRSADKYEGDLKSWYETLEPGEPNALVRKAIADAEKAFSDRGDDLSHSDIIELQHRAIRLGAEGNPGVPALLEKLEELTLNRTGAHSRDPEEYLYEFQEGLVSGISKHGAAIELRKNLPDYSISQIPSSVPDHLVSGDSGTKENFRELLARLIDAGVDDLTATSILWGNPKTGGLAKDWGLEFVHMRVQEARRHPEPVRENPTLALPEDVEVLGDDHSTSEFLTDKELEQVKSTYTFIDAYVAASATKGFVNVDYAVPAAWSCLSMAFGRLAYVPIGATPLEMNLWFNILGYSGTGKTSESRFMRDVLNVLMVPDEGVPNYTMSANSSPEGMETDLLSRDGLATLIYEDEASSFFMNLRSKDWMNSLPDKFAHWYDGEVYGGTKLSLKELRGKRAKTSLSSYMGGTPERLVQLIDAPMFASGFLARTNWVWGKPPENPDAKYEVSFSETTEKRVSPAVFDLVLNLLVMRGAVGEDTPVNGTDRAAKRVMKAYKAFDKKAQKHPRYESIEPSITRLKETLMKCSALMALSRGATQFDVEDVTIAVYYAETWFNTLMRLASEIAESPYSRDVQLIEDYVRKSGGKATRPSILHEFKGLISRSQRELEDRLTFLVDSGRLNRVGSDGSITYELNGG